jgi:hypothetical protein
MVPCYPPPPTLNRQQNKGQGTQGCTGKDCTKDTIKTPYMCGEQNGKWAGGRKKGEGIG